MPFNDPAVQAAVAQADAILTGAKATFQSPVLIATSTSLQNSVVSFVQTSAPFDISTCGPPSGGVMACAGAVFTVTTSVTFGPATIFVGEDHSNPFTILAGQIDTNINIRIELSRSPGMR